MELRLKTFSLSCFFSALLFALASGAMAQTSSFEVGSIGCPMAHCDGQMTDNPRLPAPVWPSYHNHLFSSAGSSLGLGCASNGTRAACSFVSNLGAVKVFDRDGNLAWDSGSELNTNSWLSAPIIDMHNHVIAADDEYIIRFNENGQVIWKARIPGGAPISPVENGQDLILVGTKGGPVSTFFPDRPNDSDGDGIDAHFDAAWVSYDTFGQVLLTANMPLLGTYYDVDNTPVFNSRGDRVYITMAKAKWPKQGALVALDVDPANGKLSLAWAWPFPSPSGASPLVVENVKGHNGQPIIYFDGRYDSNGDVVAQIFAVVDNGTYASELWSHKVDPPTTTPPDWWGNNPRQKTIDASFTSDPDHGCFWYYTTTWHEALFEEGSDTSLRCLSFEGKDGHGEVKMEINPGCLFESCDRYVVSGLPSMTLSRENGSPELIFNANGMIGTIDPLYYPYQRDNKIAAVIPPHDLNHNGELDWVEDLPINVGLEINQSKNTAGQFGILSADPAVPNSATRIIFSTVTNGVHVIGDKF